MELQHRCCFLIELVVLVLQSFHTILNKIFVAKPEGRITKTVPSANSYPDSSSLISCLSFSMCTMDMIRLHWQDYLENKRVCEGLWSWQMLRIIIRCYVLTNWQNDVYADRVRRTYYSCRMSPVAKQTASLSIWHLWGTGKFLLEIQIAL